MGIRVVISELLFSNKIFSKMYIMGTRVPRLVTQGLIKILSILMVSNDTKTPGCIPVIAISRAGLGLISDRSHFIFKLLLYASFILRYDFFIFFSSLPLFYWQFIVQMKKTFKTSNPAM